MLNKFPMYNNSMVRKVLIALVALVVLFIAAVAFLYLAVVRAPSGTIYPVKIRIESGQGVQSIAEELYEQGVVRQPKFVQNLIISNGGEKKIQAGIYVFKTPLNVFNVARRIASGDFGYVPVRLTVPEGTNSKKLAVLINAKFPYIATSTFETLAREHEGYLFPETYFFYPEATEQEIIDRMSVIFERKIDPLNGAIASTTVFSTGTSTATSTGVSAVSPADHYLMNLEGVMTLASILEGEVQTKEDKAMVADLLERRLRMGMRLQVDSTLVYGIGKGSSELTLKDLRTDGPYNTYTRSGLPPTPISNPGLDSIEAVLNPMPNEYLFYLSDKDGITHFSKTHEEHVKLKEKYLR
jgi:UPF0755 protein